MRQRLLVAFALSALAIAARLPDVWRLALSQDEVASARVLREPTLVGAVHRIVRTESTPPLWYALGWTLHHTGISLVGVRLLSVAFGGLLAAAVFFIASAVVAAPYAAAAGALVALGYEPLSHGSELRAYELLALLAALLALVLACCIRRSRRLLDAALALVVWAGLLTHYFFLFSVTAALAWLWLEPRAHAARGRATAAIAAGAAAAAPWLPAFLVQYRQDRFWWIGRFDPRVVVVTPLRVFAPLGVRHLGLGLVVLATVAVGAVALVRRSPEGRLVVALALGPIVLAALLWAGGARIFAVRNLIETAPFLATAVVTALAALPRRTAMAAAAVAVAAVGAVWISQTTLPTPPYQHLARMLVAEGWGPRDPIAVVGNVFQFRAPLEWYLPHAPVLDVSRPSGRPCRTLFVIESHVGGYTVERVSGKTALDLHARHRATLLASINDPPACVRLSRNPHLMPLA